MLQMCSVLTRAWLVRSKKVLTVLHENYDLSDLQSPLVFFAAEPNYMFLE